MILSMKSNLFLFAIFCLISCNNIKSQITENISAAQFYNLSNEQAGIIIDVRTPQEFSTGHIKEATNIDFYSNEFKNKLKIMKKDIPIYVYCRSGGRSSIAASRMQKLGFIKIYNLAGGINAWKASNFKLVTSSQPNKFIAPVVHVNQVDSILKENKMVFITVSTEWCLPCKKMKPVIQEIEKENYDVKFLYIDADVNKDILDRFKINGVPFFLIYKNSKELFRHVGVISKNDIMQQLN